MIWTVGNCIIATKTGCKWINDFFGTGSPGVILDKGLLNGCAVKMMQKANKT